MAIIDLLLLFLLLQAVFFTFSATCSHHRHLLHQPFFPLESTPPSAALPPLTSSLPPQLQPKQPFSATPSTPQKPFFQSFRSSPPPPAPAVLGSFPANITSILFPRHPSPEKPFSRKLAAIAIAVSLLSAALISAVAALVLYYRRHRRFSVPDKSSRAEGLRLYPPNTATSDGGSSGSGGGGASHKPRSVASNTSSEFLYLGTLVNSRGVDDESVANSGNAGTGIGIGVSNVPATAYRKLGSPELTPLPPLPRSVFKQSSGNAKVGVGLSSSSDDEEEEEEFFSPRASLGGKDSPKRTASSSRRLFDGIGVDNYGSTSFNSRTPSYTRSTSASHSDSVSSTSSPLLPLNPNPKSPDFPVDYPAPSRPPPPPPLQQPRTPSASSSSPVIDSGNTHNSPVRISNVSATSNGSGSPQSVVPMKLPPPPPPLPPPRFWEAPATPRIAQEPISGPPVHVAPSRPVVLQNLVPISPAQDQSSQSDGATETPRPKLKPLHWDKVRASSDRVMVWDQIKTSSFQLNEEMIETLFTVNGPSSTPKDNVRRQVLPATQQENRVLDPKKSQNIAILLRALNVTIDEVCEALLEGNADTLGTELLESLLKMAPTKEEERKLKEFKDETPIKLGPAEKFLKAVLDIPFAFKRVEAMLYITNFDSEVQYLFKSFETLEEACEELRTSRMFLKLLEAVLKTGNRMNVGTNRGDAHAFKLDTLLKLADVKGADGKTTLLHFVVQEIIKAEGYRQTSATNISEIEQSQESPLQDVEFRKLGLQVVSGLCGELTSVKKAAAMDSDVLSSEVMKLARGISKIEEVLTLNESSQKFSESINGFLKKAKEEIGRIQAQEKVAFSMVKEITEYFHGNSSKEEAHRFRIFMVVRDFLSELDKVCKEVGKINERTIVGAARSQVPAPPFHDGLYFR